MSADLGRRMRRYAVLGVGSNLACYLLFLVLLWLRIPPVTATAICYIVGMTISYFGNRLWAFQSTSGHGHDLTRFGLAHLLGLSSSVLSMSLLVQVMTPAFAQVVTVLVAALVIFTALSVLRFGGARR